MTLNLEQWLLQTIRLDTIYQETLTALLSMEEEYQRILQGLTAHDRALLEQYITLSEELEHRQTHLLIEKCWEDL